VRLVRPGGFGGLHMRVIEPMGRLENDFGFCYFPHVEKIHQVIFRSGQMSLAAAGSFSLSVKDSG
jgi:hypothetical protein